MWFPPKSMPDPKGVIIDKNKVWAPLYLMPDHSPGMHFGWPGKDGAGNMCPPPDLYYATGPQH